jgi:hypothetical protein
MEQAITIGFRACRFNTTLVRSAGVPFAALAKREGVSPSYFTRSSASAISPRTSPKRSLTGISRAI